MSTFIVASLIFGTAGWIVIKKIKKGFGAGCSDCASPHCPVKKVEQK